MPAMVLQVDLPLTSSSSVFVRADEQKMVLWRALITVCPPPPPLTHHSRYHIQDSSPRSPSSDSATRCCISDQIIVVAQAHALDPKSESSSCSIPVTHTPRMANAVVGAESGAGHTRKP